MGLMSFADHIERVDRAVQGHLGSVTVTYRLPGGDPVDVPGMFDENYLLVDQGSGGGVEQRTPAVWLMLDDLPGDPTRDRPTITIAGVEYTVRERQPDSVVGDSILLLLHRKRA